MKNIDEAVEPGFYKKCAELLGVEDTYRRYPHFRRDRWNTRLLGNGRFIGYGIIRMFNENLIHMSLNKPRSVNKVFKSPDEALDFLRLLLDSPKEQS